MKKGFILGFIIATILFVLIICIYKFLPIGEIEKTNTEKNDYINNQEYNNNTDNNIINISKNEVKNNGKTVVEYNGKTYFWKLNKKSRSETGIFQYYSNENVKNELVCMDGNGIQNVILNDFGYGRIYISNNRIFLSNDFYTPDNPTYIYSVNLDGTDKKEYEGITSIYGCNENYIIAEKDTKVVSINTKTNEIIELFDSRNENGEIGDLYAGIIGNTVYFNNTSSEKTKPLIVSAIEVDGTNRRKIKEIDLSAFENLEIFEAEYYTFRDYMQMIQFEEYNGYIYMIYGYYSGSGNYLQYSEVSRMRLDGEDFEVLKSEYEYFKIFEKDGKTYLSLNIIDQYDEINEKELNINLNTLQEENVVNPYSEESIKSKNNINFKEKQEWEEDYKQISYIDDYAYYLLDYSSLYPEGDIGWRVGYKWEKSYYIKHNIITNEVEVLYEIN